MQNVEIAVVRGNDYVTIFNVSEGSHYTVDATHVNYESVLEALDNGDDESALKLISVAEVMMEFINGTHFTFEKGFFHYRGQIVDNSLTRRIIAMKKEGRNVEPMVKFLDNLLANPSSTAVKELYLFLDNHEFPITTDGHFLAYKIVTKDFKDIYTKTMDNSPGQVVEMERNLVDDDRARTCSHGLHFCSAEYLPHYGRPDLTGKDPEADKVVIVKINPADVVSIPRDYNNAKGRTCKYKVIGEYHQMKPDLTNRSIFSN